MCRVSPYREAGSRHAQMDSAIPDLTPRGEQDARRGVIAFALLAPVGDVLFFFAKAIDDPAQAFGFDALFAPRRAPRFVLGPRVFQGFQVLAQCLAQPLQKRAVVL